MRTDENGSSKKGCSDLKYCLNGKPKPPKQQKPQAPNGGDRNRDCSLFDRVCNAWVAVDYLFDPYTGAYPYGGHNYDQPFDLTGVSPATFNSAMANAYIQNGINLSYYGANSVSNPLTEHQFAWEMANSESLQTSQLYKQVMINSQHKPYGTFLLFTGVPPDNIMNFESNYLDALMDANPRALRDAKEYYLNTVVLQTPSIWQQMLNEGTPLWPAPGGPNYE